MPALRILGGIAAFALFVFAISRYRRRQISRLNLIISCVLSILIVALAIAPQVFNPIFTTFNFGPGNDRRLIFVLMISVIVLFALMLRVQSIADVNERAIRLLVEALGQERFDWERVAALPEGPRLVTVSPAFNEAENVAAVIHAMPAVVEGYRVVPVVVSDGSDGRGGASGGSVRRRAAHPARRRACAPRGLRGRVEDGSRHRCDARCRRSTPAGRARGDDRSDRPWRGRLRERLAPAR
jgi:hypothetical protein